MNTFMHTGPQFLRMSHPVADYLHDLHRSLGVGVPETSGYPALRNRLARRSQSDSYSRKLSFTF